MSVVSLPERPEPPSHLSEAEGQLWREVVATKPADWFQRDSHPILCAYIQSTLIHRLLMDQFHAGEFPIGCKPYSDLVGMIVKVSGSVAQLGAKLRLTQQSRYTPQSAGTAAKKAGPVRPWENAKSDAR